MHRKEAPGSAGIDRAASIPALVVCLVLALALGVYADVGLRASGAFGDLPAVATPWLVLPFCAARAVRGLALALTVGMVTLVVGLASYYGWLVLGQDVAVDTVMRHYRAPVWIAVGAAVGAGFGLLGWLSREANSLGRAVAWCGVVSVPIVDAWRLRGGDGTEDPGIVIPLVVVAVGLLAWALRASRLPVIALVAGTALTSLALWQAEILVLRHVFDQNV